MLRDLGSRDAEFLGVVREVRAALLRIAGVAEPDYTALPLQGSGTYHRRSRAGGAAADGRTHPGGAERRLRPAHRSAGAGPGPAGHTL